jgi:osmoprotectant transport system permease protein
VIRWDVIAGNLPLLGSKLVEHVQLTVVAVAFGLVLSALAVLAIRRRRVLAGPLTGLAGFLYTIPSLALLAFLVPITGLSFATAEIALVSYTLLILTRNILAGLDAVPAEVRETAEAMGYGPARRLWLVEVPLALPLIVAGIRLATVTTIGLTMVTAVVGIGGLGQVMLRGFNFRNETLVYAGFVLTVGLALLADIGLGWLGRRLSPWAAKAGG